MITSVDIKAIEPLANGAAFGEVGAYERVIGVAKGEVDPMAPGNKGIALIDKAPLIVFPTDFVREFGQPNPPLGGTALGLVGSDTQASVGLVYSTSATTLSPPGSYPIVATLASGNYREFLTPGTLVVAPPQATTTQAATVNAAIEAAIEQGSIAAQQQQAAVAATQTLASGRIDFVARIIEGFDTKLNSPRQALFIVLPNDDGTVGAITVDDGKTQTLLDKPYAAAELRSGEAMAAEIDPEQAESLFGERRRRKKP